MIFHRLIAVCLFLLFVAPAFAQDSLEEAPVMESVTVMNGEAPLPIVGRGAPNYSPEQTASFICVNQDAGLARILTGPIMQRAHDRTLEARQARIDYRVGKITEAAMVEAELRRQEAVENLGRRRLDRSFTNPARGDLDIEDIAFARVLENGRAVLRVTGSIVNRGRETREIPPLALGAFDVRDFFLGGQTTQVEETHIGPGDRTPFMLRFKNPPAYTVKVLAHFAPPFEYRNFRGCDFFDPLEFDPTESAVRRNVARRGASPPDPVPDVGEGAPRYTASELAVLASRARREAELALESRRDVCPALPGRDDWRSRMKLADALEEAWMATNAAEETRRDAPGGIFIQEEVEGAELARQAAVRSFMGARQLVDVQPISHSGLSIRNVEVRRRGDVATVTGEFVNSGRDRVSMPPLRVVVRDRFGFAAAESFQRPRGEVRPDRSERFSFDYSLPAGLAANAQVELAC